jgi:NAD(P) transhydrogenase subunit beta
MNRFLAIEWAYFAASVLFIMGLKWMNSPRTARRGMFLAELGMLCAVLGTLLHSKIITYEYIALGLCIGAVLGAVMAIWTPMTAMPQRTALSHACGALAASLVGVAEYRGHGHHMGTGSFVALVFEVLLGGLTVTGSLMAFGKLQELLPGKPITYRGQHWVNAVLLLAVLVCGVWSVADPHAAWAFYAMVGLAALFGVLLVMPIGAADMPVVIALLNSYAGLAGCATGFALGNNILIIAGALDGASGFILSVLMCKAMNRSITNVLFGAFGAVSAGASAGASVVGTVRSAQPDEVASLLDVAERVVIVPGYGMAVSQAQHIVKKCAETLAKRGVDVCFAIHPVAGRMPGHMNVLLAEAGVDYGRLVAMEDINDSFNRVDVVLVIGANDVVNPAAKTDPSSPIYGMPVLNVDQARSVVVLKRSMNPGFAGIENNLFYLPQTMMVFGDAVKTVEEMNKALVELGHA